MDLRKIVGNFLQFSVRICWITDDYCFYEQADYIFFEKELKDNLGILFFFYLIFFFSLFDIHSSYARGTIARMTTIATTGAHQTEPVPAGHESGYNRSLLGEMFSQPSSSEDVSSAAIIDRKDTVTTATTTTPMTTGAATAGETQAVRYAPMEPHESYPSWEDSFDFLADFWKSEPGLASDRKSVV